MISSSPQLNAAFNDLRLIDPAIRALGDNYPGLADLVAEKILPGYGPGIIPRLKANFDLKGKRQDARKLEVMQKLDPPGMLDLCKKALEDGSVELRVAAIGCLGKHEDCLPLLLEQSNSKNKEVRAAALEALAIHERPEITKIFTELIKGKALDVLVAPFRALRNRQVLNSLLDEGRKSFDLMLKDESEQILRFAEILKCLDSRKDTEVETFLLDAFVKSGALVKLKAGQNSAITGLDLMARLAGLLHGLGTPKAMDAILDKRELLPAAVFPLVLDGAFPTLPADKFFSEFSPLLKEKPGTGPGWIKRDYLEHFFLEAYQENRRSSDKSEVNDRRLTPHQLAWDPRWLDAAIKADSHRMVCILARPDHKPSLEYLLKPVNEKQQPGYSVSFTVEALARCRHPKVTEFFTEQVTAKAKGTTFLHYELQTLLEAAKYLPKSDLPKLDAFATKFDQRFVDAFLIAINPLRATNQST